MKNKQHLKNIIIDIGTLVASGFLFSVAYNMFFLPGKVFVGGAGGVAEVLNILYGLPTGLMIIAINVPLALCFCIFYGWRSGAKSLAGIVFTSLAIDITSALGFLPEAFPAPEENAFLCAIFGGLTLGSAIGLMFYRGFTTGGSDFVAFLLKLKIKKISTAKLIAMVDALVILFAAIATKNFLSVFYSLVSVLISSTAIEIVTGGFEKTKIAFIFSNKYEIIADAVSTKLQRGVTLIDGEGWYTKEKKHVVFCVVKKNERFILKTMVKEIDPSAFIVLGNATETIGEGFKTGVGDTSIEPIKIQKIKENKK